MSDEPLTLKHFFLDGEKLAVRGEQIVEHLRERVSEAGANVAAAALDGALASAFEVPLGDLLHRSWGQLGEIREAIDAGRRDKEHVAVIPLLEHAIATTHTPTLDLLYGGKRLARVPVQIELNLLLNGVAIELKGGKFTGLRSGHCAGQGAVTIAGVALVEQETPGIHLPGRVGFAH
jgi:hypothetical protein